MEFPKHGRYTASGDGLRTASTQTATFGMIMCLTIGHAFVICNVEKIGISANRHAMLLLCMCEQTARRKEAYRKMIRHRTAVDNPVEEREWREMLKLIYVMATINNIRSRISFE